MPLIGRTEEVREFLACLDSPEAEFVAVTGRRRVGKTYLVRNVFAGRITFFVTGLARAGMKDQLENFGTALREQGGDDEGMPSSWMEAFRRLRTFLEGQRVPGKRIVFIDEMPWLDTPKSRFRTALEWFWNGWASAQPDVLLIVCGSATSWIVSKLFRDTGGLHNRVTRRIHLQPFTLAECVAFYAERGIVMSTTEILEAYMILGGIPFYLSRLDKSRSLAQNISRLCFREGGMLRTEFDDLYASLFARPEQHVRIVRALASRRCGLSREDIAAMTGISLGGGITRTLRELEQSGFIRSYQPFGRKARGTLYQLMDPYTLFYLTFIETEPADPDFWSKYAATSAHSAWAGNAFERVCLAHVPQIKAKLGIAGVIVAAHSWRSGTSDPGAQVDLVLDRRDGVVNLCEMKYARGAYAITKAADAAMRAKVSAFRAETRTRKAVHVTYVTTFGLTRNQYSGDIQSEVIAADLFREVAI